MPDRRPALARRVPDQTQNYTESHVGRGADYDDGFASLPVRSLMWEMEQEVLHDLVARTGARSVLDFACGTGRITEVLARELPDADVVGVDVAASMLAVAQTRVPTARFLNADGTDLGALVPDGTVDLVSAFRFFPNADPPLRAAATAAITTAVRPGGFVVLNNHRNFWSSSYVARRLRPGADAPGALNSQVVDPFLERGFTVVERRSLGVLPQSDERMYVGPQRLALRLERRLRRLARSHTAGTNTIWLLRKH